MDGCPLSGLCVFLGIHMCKMEDDIVVPAKPIFINVMLMIHTYAEKSILMMNYSRV